VVRVGFRTRLLLILAVFAVAPAVIVSAGAFAAFREVVPLLGGGAAWDSVAVTGRAAIAAARAGTLTPDEHAALDAHERILQQSTTRALQVRFLSPRLVAGFALAVVALLLLLAYPVVRVAGHLSRQLSRPVEELVGWAGLIERGEQLPSSDGSRGAPEFDVLRERMRAMASELEAGRARLLEAERLRAFRESARRFAHELKNPLTPVRFAVARLRRDAPPSLSETVDVLATETARLETMARSFAQFGRLPEGPAADIDVAELITYTARSTVPEASILTLDVATDLPHIRGHHDTISRALSNLLLNAVDASGSGGSVTVRAQRAAVNGQPGVSIAVSDTGPGVVASDLQRIWEPYVTSKPGGTGLGLAIARAAVEAHGGSVFARSEPGRTEIGFILPENDRLPAITGEWRVAAPTSNVSR
jgi:two-component system nitrogen regulation sensor histidine kinase NtrY